MKNGIRNMEKGVKAEESDNNSLFPISYCLFLRLKGVRT